MENMIANRILAMLQRASGEDHNFPHTDLYNEGWLLRLILDWFDRNRDTKHTLSFHQDARWFSEARLYTAFHARFRGDQRSETHTHSDGIVGHFSIRNSSKTGLSLLSDAKQFLVLEAKVSSGLSKGIKNAPDYDQAARTVACMAEILHLANQPPSVLTQIGFYVLAPQPSIDKKTFIDKKTGTELVTIGSIQEKVLQRVQQYDGDRALDDWYHTWFEPMLPQLDIGILSWEGIIEHIYMNDREAGEAINRFYQQCLEFNKR